MELDEWSWNCKFFMFQIRRCSICGVGWKCETKKMFNMWSREDSCQICVLILKWKINAAFQWCLWILSTVWAGQKTQKWHFRVKRSPELKKVITYRLFLGPKPTSVQNFIQIGLSQSVKMTKNLISEINDLQIFTWKNENSNECPLCGFMSW